VNHDAGGWETAAPRGRAFWRLVVLIVCAALPAAIAAAERTPVRALKVTVLSTMLADGDELGEWGFAALVEVDGRRILFDTGAKTDVVAKNVRTLKLDLADVPDLILSHWHWDHVGGLMTLRREAMARQPSALARTHVAEGFFDSRIGTPPGVELNQMIRVKPDYEETGGKFIVHAKPVELQPGVWLTGPVPRQHPERNWSGNVRVKTAAGVREDIISDDMALVIDTAQGLVIVTGCGHAGVINIVEHARTFVRPARVHALIGGVHLFRASEQTLTWTAEKLRGFGIDHFIGAHCTGIETVYRLRGDLGLDRAHCVVGAVGQIFELGKGIDARTIAK
jgi:7,8-dihydropterin-6-yl-methyl-4-(beta-D-ribofuranosyl)aminobenzene 5'-phosphate synthase